MINFIAKLCINRYAFPMADPRLVQALEYILNRSDESSIEVLAEAVVRRRRELSMFGTMSKIPDPQRMAEEISDKLNTGIGAGIETLKKSVRDMTVRIIKEHAPELNDDQIEELCQTWIPQAEGEGNGSASKASRDMMASMIEQFISFSRGTMSKEIDNELRETLGEWPQRYWNVFPPVIRLIITDFLKDRITEEEFNSKAGIALEL
jgi:hypothetical protein